MRCNRYYTVVSRSALSRTQPLYAGVSAFLKPKTLIVVSRQWMLSQCLKVNIILPICVLALNGGTGPQQNPPAPRLVPQHVVKRGHRYSVAQRVQCLTLRTEGFSSKDIEKKSGVRQQSQSNIWGKALEHGFRPAEDPRILEHYVEDGQRSGRPKGSRSATGTVP